MVIQSVNLTLNLSEDKIREAEAMGILTPEAVEQWVREQLAWERDARQVREIRDALQNLPDPITPEEIEAEIEAYRAEKRAKREAQEE